VYIFFGMTYRLATIHPWQTDGQTDRQTDDISCHRRPTA